jgi:hypothetical protein
MEQNPHWLVHSIWRLATGRRQNPAHVLHLPEMPPGMGVENGKELQQIDSEVAGDRTWKSHRREVQAMSIFNPLPHGRLSDQKMLQFQIRRT